jgi:hypothetical protein
MKLENASKIFYYLEDKGTPVEIFEGYSGRGMYGEETTGIVVDNAMDVAHAMGHLGIEDNQRTDSMGLQTIVY